MMAAPELVRSFDCDVQSNSAIAESGVTAGSELRITNIRIYRPEDLPLSIIGVAPGQHPIPTANTSGAMNSDRASLHVIPLESLPNRLLSDTPSLGRKPDTRSRPTEILERFDAMCKAGKVSFVRGGLAGAARILHGEFSDYKEDSIRKIIHPSFRERRDKR